MKNLKEETRYEEVLKEESKQEEIERENHV